MSIKLYSPTDEESLRHHSPGVCVGGEKWRITGNPDVTHVSSSYVERQNFTMGMRRFTPVTNGFSKRAENLAHAGYLHFMYCNFARVHQTLKMTPQYAWVADHQWTLEEIATLLDRP